MTEEEKFKETPTPKPPLLTKSAKRREKRKRRAVEVKTDDGLDCQQLMEKMAGASVEPSLLATPTKSQTYSVVIKTPAEAPSKKPTTSKSARPAAPTSTQPTGPPPGPPLPPPSLKSVRGPPPLSSDKSTRTVAVRVQKKMASSWLAEIEMQELGAEEKRLLEKFFEDKPVAAVAVRKSPTQSLNPANPMTGLHREVLLQAAMKTFDLPISDVLDLLEHNKIDDEQTLKRLNAAWPSSDECEELARLEEDQLKRPLDHMCWVMARRSHLKPKLEMLLMLESKPEKIAGLKRSLDKWEQSIGWMRHDAFARILRRLLQWINYLNKGSYVDEVRQIGLAEVADILGRKSTDKEQSTTIGQLLMDRLDLKTKDLWEIQKNLETLMASDMELKSLEEMTATEADDIATLEERLGQEAALKKKQETIEQMKSGLDEVRKRLGQLKTRADDTKRYYGEEEKVPVKEIIKHLLGILQKGLEALSGKGHTAH